MNETADKIKTHKSRARILNYPVDLLDKKRALDLAGSWINSRTGGQIVTINPEMIIMALKNPELSKIINEAELIIPDGSGIIVALKKLKINIKQMPGIDFSESLIRMSAEKGYTVGFLGAANDVIEEAANEFKAKYQSLRIVFKHNGYFKEEEEPEIIDKLKQANPQILFVALGAPKQELWIGKYKKILNSTIMIGVGGSFDIWAKKIKRAPVIFRQFGLEWFFRLITQPSRFRRMFPSLPLFFVRVMFDNKYTRKEC